jgi:lambda family phage portal protein
MYAAARLSRLNSDWKSTNSSADTELVASIITLRARSRQLVRDSSFAKRARTIVVNNVIGSGIGLQAQVKTSRDVLNDRVNSDIEDAWCQWAEAENCHTGGRLAFQHLERACMGQVFEAGEVFIRKHYSAFGAMGVPFALEMIEAERIADYIDVPFVNVQPGNQFRMGIEVDAFQKPVAYWIRKRHPGEILFYGDYNSTLIERVPADQIIHLAVIDRWPQTRGEPWLHSAARRLNDMDGYAEAEIIRARTQASMAGGIETPENSESFGDANAADGSTDDGSVEMEMEPGILKRTNPGEKIILPSPTSPNPAADPFMRMMLREVAAGAGVSYESLSRDYSQTSYSSGRLALLDDRDLWKFFQSWFICDFRSVVHKEWLRQTVLAQKIPSISVAQYALDPRKFEAVRYKPRGWSWIDPTSEVTAYKMAVRSGFTTVTDVIAATAGGQDVEDILDTRRRELDLMKAKDLTFETDPVAFNDKGQTQPLPADPNVNVTGTEVPVTPVEAQSTAPKTPPGRVVSLK